MVGRGWADSDGWGHGNRRDDGGVFEGGDEGDATVAGGALQGVKSEGSFEKGSPIQAALAGGDQDMEVKRLRLRHAVAAPA